MDETASDFSYDDTASVDDNVCQLIGLIKTLSTVIDEENRQLSTGLAASPTGSVPLKSALATKLNWWTARLDDKTIVLQGAAPQLRETLAQCNQILATAMQENLVRIKSAIDVTNSRVNAVMSAIREQSDTNRSYHANGRAETRSRPASLTAGLRV